MMLTAQQIMLKAEQNGISPEQQIANVKAEHEADFAGFHIAFDNYPPTFRKTVNFRVLFI